MMHDRADLIDYQHDEYQTYQQVNALFAKKISEFAAPDDLIWVQDYHFLSVARHCRELGMSLHEIEDLNELRKDPQQQCKVVDQAIEQHLGHINHKIQQFEKFKIQLEQLRARCQSNSNIDDCKIIETLKQHDHLG